MSEFPNLNCDVNNILLKKYEDNNTSIVEKYKDQEIVSASLYRNIMYLNNKIESVILIPENSNLIYWKTKGNINPKYSVKDEEWYNKIIKKYGEKVIIGVHKDYLTPKYEGYVISVGRNIIKPYSNESLGTIFLNVNVRDLSKLWKDVSFTQNSKFYLVDEYDKVIYSKDFYEIGKSIDKISTLHIENGLFVPLNKYVNDGTIDISNLEPSVKDIWTVDGNLYGYPLSESPAAFIVNMDMWNAAGLGDLPKTWKEVKEAAKVLTKGDVKGLCTPNHEYHLTQYALSFGGGWGNGKTINSAGNIEGLQYIIDMYKDGLSVTPKELGLAWDGDVFSKGKAAMTTGGHWYVSFLAEAAPELNYEIIPMPKGNVNSCTMHCDAIVVLTGTKHEKEAVKATNIWHEMNFRNSR